MNLKLGARIEDWPIAGAFVISRGAKSSARVVVATISAGGVSGHGECAPYARYGETPERTRDEILAKAPLLRSLSTCAQMREAVNAAMQPGAARNALDCALWDLEARTRGMRAWRLARLERPAPAVTAFTISLASKEDMARAAAACAARPLLKLKLGGDDAERIAAVRAAAPNSRLIVDANESWTKASWARNLAACIAARVELIEQPFPANDDAILESIPRPVPVCADESAHDAPSIPALAARYDAVNVKLDKAGGLTGALQCIEAARAHGMGVMLGCMVGTSLAVAPALLLAARADIVDLDGPLHLQRDRDHAIAYDGSIALPARPELWG
ncbi:MAG: dipeptide epimerase [Beijerinckiaceae bacterium]|nr:dipeptide epimerase [Beijerinckiaceae bacterium]